MNQISSQICISLGCKGERHIKNKQAFLEHQILGHQIMLENRFVQELQIFMENRQNSFINYSSNKLQEKLKDYEQRLNQNIKEFIDDVFELIQRDIINKSNEEFDFINISDEIQNKEQLDDLVEMFNGSQTQPLIKTNQFNFQISQIEIKLQRLEIQLQSTLTEHLNLILHLQQSQPKQLSKNNNKQGYSSTEKARNNKQIKKSTIIQRSNIQRNTDSNTQQQSEGEITKKPEGQYPFIQLNHNQSEQDNESNLSLSTQNGKGRKMNNISCKSDIIDMFEQSNVNSDYIDQNYGQEQQFQKYSEFHRQYQFSQKDDLYDISQRFGGQNEQDILKQNNHQKSEVTQNQQKDQIQSVVQQTSTLRGQNNHNNSGLLTPMQQQIEQSYSYNNNDKEYQLKQSNDENLQITLDEHGDSTRTERSFSLQVNQSQEVIDQSKIFNQHQNQDIYQLPLKGYKQHDYSRSLFLNQQETFESIKYDNSSVSVDIRQQQQQEQQQYQQQQKKSNCTTQLPLKGYKTHNYTQSCQDNQDHQAQIKQQNLNNLGNKQYDQNTEIFYFRTNINYGEKKNYKQKNQKKIKKVEIYQEQNNSTYINKNQIIDQSFCVLNSDCSVQYKKKFTQATFQDLGFATINTHFTLEQNAEVSFNIVGSSQKYLLKIGVIEKNQFSRESLLGSMQGVYCIDKDGSLFIEGEKSKQLQDHSIVPNLRVDMKYVSQTRALMFVYQNKSQCIQMKQNIFFGQFQFFIYSKNLTVSIV